MGLSRVLRATTVDCRGGHPGAEATAQRRVDCEPVGDRDCAGRARRGIKCNTAIIRPDGAEPGQPIEIVVAAL